ncbi:MAG: DUF3467 domain-containing protein [Chlorobi bacterium]|nr:DUF3467 domain-containing protein [Chlorobiota bacterium]
MSEPKKGHPLNIELKEDVAQGIYSNLAIINHSVSEFVIDFVSIMPGVNKAQVRSRVILTPQHAKKFLRALQENIRRFEAVHGTIKEYGDKSQGPPITFGPQGEA